MAIFLKNPRWTSDDSVTISSQDFLCAKYANQQEMKETHCCCWLPRKSGECMGQWGKFAQIVTLASWLVVYLPLWKIWKSMGRIFPDIMGNIKCSKPPTSQFRSLCHSAGSNLWTLESWNRVVPRYRGGKVFCVNSWWRFTFVFDDWMGLIQWKLVG